MEIKNPPRYEQRTEKNGPLVLVLVRQIHISFTFRFRVFATTSKIKESSHITYQELGSTEALPVINKKAVLQLLFYAHRCLRV